MIENRISIDELMKIDSEYFIRIELFDGTKLNNITVKEVIESKLPCYFIFRKDSNIMTNNYQSRIINDEYIIINIFLGGKLTRKYRNPKDLSAVELEIINTFKLMELI